MLFLTLKGRDRQCRPEKSHGLGKGGTAGLKIRQQTSDLNWEIECEEIWERDLENAEPEL